MLVSLLFLLPGRRQVENKKKSLAKGDSLACKACFEPG